MEENALSVGPVNDTCIWCGKQSTKGEPIEHIVPEALGCPVEMTLSHGEVCGSCNNRLGHLDMALVHDLEGYAFMAGVPRKKNRPPVMESYGNLKAEVREGNPTFYFNMEPHSITTKEGRRISGFRGKPRDVKAELKRKGEDAELSFSLEFGRSPKVARALVKIGAEYFCLVKGRQMAASVVRGAIRDFVFNGTGFRPIILKSPYEKYEHNFGLISHFGTDNWFCWFKLAHFEVIIDLSPKLIPFKSISEELTKQWGDKNWTTLPLGSEKLR